MQVRRWRAGSERRAAITLPPPALAAVDKFESKSKLAQGVGRAAYFPLHVVYYCRPSPANLHRILMDYSAPVEDAPDCFERYFPCIFGDITLTVPPPMYNRASLVITAARAGAGQDNAALAAAELLRQSRASAEFQRFGEYFNPHTVVPVRAPCAGGR